MDGGRCEAEPAADDVSHCEDGDSENVPGPADCISGDQITSREGTGWYSLEGLSPSEVRNYAVTVALT